MARIEGFRPLDSGLPACFNESRQGWIILRFPQKQLLEVDERVLQISLAEHYIGHHLRSENTNISAVGVSDEDGRITSARQRIKR